MPHFRSQDSSIERTIARSLALERDARLLAHCRETGQAARGRGNENPWSQKNTAKRLGVSNVTLFNWENGVSCPKLGTFLQWCHVLDKDFCEELRDAAQKVKEGKGW